MKHSIKSRFTGQVIYECEIPETLKPEFHTRHVLIEAVKSRADLYGANLYGANLSGANLSGADLSGADLSRADLSGADLSRADLSRADLSRADLYGADLSGANLYGADLYGANLSGAKLNDLTLIGERPFFQLGPIGSRNDYLLSFITDSGVFVRVGCFFGSLDEFSHKVTENHGDSVHGEEYRAAITMIQAHAKLWTPVNGAA